MDTVLLVLSTTRESPKTVTQALARAKEKKARLVLLFVIDTALPSSIVQKLSDSSFIGDKPGEQVYQEIITEYKKRGQTKLREISDLARREGVAVDAILKEGDFVTECFGAIREYSASLVLVGRKKESKLSQFIFGSPIKKIQKNSPCPVEVVEET